MMPDESQREGPWGACMRLQGHGLGGEGRGPGREAERRGCTSCERQDLLSGFGNGRPEGSLTGGKCWEQVPERTIRETGGRSTDN